MNVAIDFDGTLVEHQYPKIGKQIPGAFNALHKLKLAGHKLILWTYRHGDLLQQAVDYCEEQGIFFDAINQNYKNEELVNINQRLINADVFIDDRNLGGLPNWDDVVKQLT